MSENPTPRDRGNAFYLQGRYAEAGDCYREALRLQPDDFDAHNNLGASLADLGRVDEAVACYHEAIRLQPGLAAAHYNLGNVLRLAWRDAEAMRSYAEALRLRPDFAEGHNNLGIVLRRQGRLTEAMTSLRRALALRPLYPNALVNLGLGLANSGRLAEAIACYDEAIRIDPENADAHHDRALAWLLVGDWSRGWAEYHWRWRCREFDPPRFDQPAWDGSPLDGRTILLYAEQGFGDVLQFARYATLVKERGGTVVVAAKARLHPLLATVPGIDRLVPPKSQSSDFDVHYPLMSLPALFGTTTETVPAPVPYVHPEPARVERWQRTLASVEGFRVGIAWQGSATMLPYDLWRSIPLDRFEPFARVDGVRLISLQKGYGPGVAGFPVLDIAEGFEEPDGAFLDTAALMANLDLVITCDTAVAHLAGALGLPTWVALPAVPDWRWLLDREDTPWYPTARLFRQWLPGRWNEPFQRMAEALGRLVIS